MESYKIVVFDIGKTNKKLFVYDSNLRCLNPEEKGVTLAPMQWNGVLCDDAAAIWSWMKDGLRRVGERFKDIRVISVSTHGATIALLGASKDRIFKGDGGLVFPIVSYEQSISSEEDAAFYRDMGMTSDELQRETATARFGWLINHGKQVHWLKSRFPQRFAEVTDVLMWPQYLGFLLTDRKAAEPTYAGCHGYLLDAGGARYSVVAERLGVADKMPPFPLSCPWDTLGTLTPEVARETGLPADVRVTVGVHDSNAALVPYFVKGFTGFVVQDSGTWVVTMSPRERAEFSDDELGREVFYNRSIYGTPIKTTIFRGGAEFEFYRDKVLPGGKHPDSVDLKLFSEIVTRREAFALPTISRGSGLFPNSVARIIGTDTVFRDAATAWCVVDLGLALQGHQAILMAGGEDVKRVFIEGNIGRNNPLYRSVISTLLAGAEVSFGNSGGASYGAAILGAAAAEDKRPEDFADRVTMEHQLVPKMQIDTASLQAYAARFTEQAR